MLEQTTIREGISLARAWGWLPTLYVVLIILILVIVLQYFKNKEF